MSVLSAWSPFWMKELVVMGQDRTRSTAKGTVSAGTTAGALV